MTNKDIIAEGRVELTIYRLMRPMCKPLHYSAYEHSLDSE